MCAIQLIDNFRHIWYFVSINSSGGQKNTRVKIKSNLSFEIIFILVKHNLSPTHPIFPRNWISSLTASFFLIVFKIPKRVSFIGSTEQCRNKLNSNNRNKLDT